MSWTNGGPRAADIGPGPIESAVAARASSAADRQVLVAQMLGTEHVKVPVRHHIAPKFYWWVVGAGSGIGLVVIGGISLLSHPGSDRDAATSACERELTVQLAPTSPLTFASERSRRTGPRSFSVEGTESSAESAGAASVWTCLVSSDRSSWTARVNLI